MDIRSYFSSASTKARPLRISDDDTPPKKANGNSGKAKKKKTVIIESDDEEDPLPTPKRKKQSNAPDNKKQSTKTTSPKLKPVNISDVFGSKPVQRTDSKQKNKDSSHPGRTSKGEDAKGVKSSTTKVVVLSESSSEEDVPPVSRGITSKQSSSPVSSSSKKQSKGTPLLDDNVEILDDSFCKDSPSKDSGKTHGHSPQKRGADTKVVSSPAHTGAKKEDIKEKRYPAKVVEVISDSSSEEDTFKSSSKVPRRSLDQSGVAPRGEKGKTMGTEERRRVNAKGGDAPDSPRGPSRKPVRTEGISRSPKSAAGKESHPPEPVAKVEIAVEQKTTPRQRKRSTGSETPQKEAHVEGQRSSSKGDDTDGSEKKKQRAMQYQRYLHREGPRNPGSKEIPKGNPNCLAGLTFVITGVLESLDRNEAAALVQECGGKVLGNVSKNTSYIVLGDEPGPAKLDKARKFGTKELSEDTLLELVRTKTKEIEEGNPSSPVGDRSGKRPIKEKREEIEPKRQKKSSEGPDKDMKPALARKLAYLMSQNRDLPTVNIAKGSQVPSVKVEGDNSMAPKTKVGSSISKDSSDVPQLTGDTTMWVDKYKPTSVKQMIGQQGEKSNVNKLIRWLSNWQKYHGPHGTRPPRPGPWEKNDDGGYHKAALLSGAPGIGKTTSALLVCKELGMDAIELNASDTRSKKLLESEVSELIQSTSLSGYFTSGKKKGEGKKKVLVMDEVDGMAGNEDRGGVAALIQLIKVSRIPVICICNDRAHPKIRSLVNYCYDLRFQRPRMEQIRGAMMSICFKEGVKVTPDALANLISSTNQDIRQVLHQLNMWSADKNNDTKPDAASSTKRKDILKDVRLGPWDVVRKVFSAEERKNTSLKQHFELFFYDYNLGPHFVFENYLKVSPKAARNIKDKLSLLAQTAESLAMGDRIQKVIRQNNAWKLLPAQAVFSTVVPGALMEGHMTGQIDFPAFFGKTSTKGKRERLAQEISLHTMVTARATKEAIKLDYASYLRDAILSPLIKESEEQMRGGGSSGVHIREALDVMQTYNLLREDLDSILELSHFSGNPDPMAKVSSKVKAAFTRAYNKDGIMTPYAVTMNVRKKRGAGGSSEDFYGENSEGDDGVEEDEVQDESIDSDAMIKIKKPSGRGGGQGGSKGGDSGRGSGKDNATDVGGKGKGRGKGASGGRGGKKRS